MPGISGTDKALMFAQFGVMRFGASRFGYTSAYCFISINGTQRREKVQFDTLTITDSLDEIPNTCQFTVLGFTPTVGMEVIITLGSTHNAERIFAGHILQVQQTQQWVNGQVFYHVSCIDYTWLLGRQKVIKKYTSESATDIATDLIQSFATGFTARNVVTGLATVDEITFTNEDLPTALTRLAKRIGAYWRADYFKDVHFGLSETAVDPVDLTTSHVSVSDVAYDTDLSQVTTRVLVEGGGVNALAEVAAGETIFPVEDLAWYSTGTVVSGPQRITYTGTMGATSSGAIVGPGVTPSDAPTTTGVIGTGIETGAHSYAYTWVTGAGETLSSPLESFTAGPVAAPSSPVGLLATLGAGGSPGMTIGATYTYCFVWGGEDTTDPTHQTSPSAQSTVVPLDRGDGISGNIQVTIFDAITIQPAEAERLVIYRTLANGSTFYRLQSYSTPIAPNFFDTTADASISGNPTLPAADFTIAQAALSGIAIGPSGTTSRNVYRTVAGGSQLKLQQSIANNTATTGVTDSTADAALTTNVPTSDTSALTQPSGQVNPGETSIVVSGTAFASSTGGWAVIGNGQQVIRYTSFSGGSLTGIPASGNGAIVAAVTYGSTITAAPSLTGIPASGDGAILYTILKGDPVNILITVNDTTAQAALATQIGGGDDGIQEEYIQDQRLSATECALRANAILLLRGAEENRLRYRCRDPRTRTGLTITFSFAGTMNISGAFKIQTVTISAFSATGTQFPTYTVDASSTKFTFESLLGMIRSRGQAA